MRWWRLSRYDPALRDTKGRFVHDVWTSIGDVGKTFDGTALTMDAYLDVEAAMVAAVQAFHRDCGRPALRLVGVEGHPPRFVDGATVVTADEIADVVRACLREEQWCRLEAPDKSCRFHFGYDYYVYLGGLAAPTTLLRMLASLGLFCEPSARSPVEDAG